MTHGAIAQKLLLILDKFYYYVLDTMNDAHSLE